MDDIIVEVQAGNAMEFPCDVLALKHAQSLYGLDRAVVDLLSIDSQNLPHISDFRIFKTNGKISAKRVLFIGVPRLGRFSYREIREFGRNVLLSLKHLSDDTMHLCLTIHGANYGLDEVESFEAEVAGLVDAVSSGEYPEQLNKITIIERKTTRAKRLQENLSRLLPNGRIPLDGRRTFQNISEMSTERLRSAGYASASKPYIFVAMPFAEEMDDIFHYGIQGAVNAAGFLCERADLTSFTGDIMNWVKERIENATLVIADLSMANPNVYLEVGYAWGKSKPTILLVRNTSELKFDVKGQRCLTYKKIKDLEQSLCNELKSLKETQYGT